MAVDQIKEILTLEDSLAHYDLELPLILACDASPVGVGAVLWHTLPDDKQKSIAYASCKLTKAQESYA